MNQLLIIQNSERICALSYSTDCCQLSEENEFYISKVGIFFAQVLLLTFRVFSSTFNVAPKNQSRFKV